ncbi:MAG: helix-hairpin-helix domain-containing protein [Chloroflexota bacterium]
MKFDQNNIGWAVALVVFGMVLGIGGLTLFKQTQPAPIVITPPQPTPTTTPTATPGPIQVYVNGAVAQEAIYSLPPGSRVQDAVQAAGGFTNEANAVVVNLVQPLFNGAQVYVPFVAEDASTPTAVLLTGSVPQNNQGAQAATMTGSLVNINTADSAQFETLPGIGPSTAEKIIAYRDENGPFAAIEAIMNVPGIGEGKFADIQDLITVAGNE